LFDEMVFKEVAPDKNFIVGIVDNMPSDGDVNWVGWVAQSSYGRLSIEV